MSRTVERTSPLLRLYVPLRGCAWVTISWVLLFTAIPTSAWGSVAGKVRKGNKEYGQGNYQQALKEYRDAQLEDPESSPLHYNIGNALYKQEKWQEAQVEYGNVLSSQDKQLAGMTNYNMGNVHYRLGNLQEAIEAYKNALRINPDDRDAKYNLEFIQKKLPENSQQQSQQSQDQESQENQQDQQQPEGQDGEEKQQEQSQKQREPGEQEEKPQEEQKGQKEEKKEDQEPAPPQPQEPGQMSQEEAVQLLNALKEQEKKAQEEYRRGQIRKGLKTEWDW
ncbi:MAG: hypothetical protein AMJ92_02015 [candidate division Zixibacteria bacterium SM23_81]|nr:MAG: hypothetical protein AMJ92_02015 [candidate division Zixibacteria bacterium SM23_81]